MAFQIVDASNRAQGRAANNGALDVSYYGKTAQFRLSPAAVEALGNPEKIEVMYDKDSGAIAFRASDAKHAVSLRKDTEAAASRYFGFRSLATLCGLPADGRVNITLSEDEAEAGTLLGNVSESLSA
jgi:hypothetical protein